MTAAAVPPTCRAGGTRRELVRGAIAAGALATVAPLLGAPVAGARTRPETDVLRRVLSVEQVVAFAYEHVLATGVLSAAWSAVLSPFLTHERQHAGVLRAQLMTLGGKLPVRPRGVVGVDEALTVLRVTKRLSELKSERDAVELLIGAEAAVIGAYYLAIAELQDGALARSAAQAMADEAQHAAVLRRLLHPHSLGQAVPNPFVQGSH